MKYLFFLFAFFIIFPLNFALASSSEDFNFERQTFINNDCAKNDTCDLKKFSILRSDYKIEIEGIYSYGTSLFAEYETNSVGALEKYGIVQFIRGCAFNSYKNKDGLIVKEKNYSKWQFDEIKEFCFTKWVIDSMDKDPFYNSDEEEPRHYLYRWNVTPNSFDKKTEEFYGEEKPKLPRLYVADLPGTAFFIDETAKNISLEFKICVYKTADIPKITTENDINFAEAIHCFYWKSSFIYNFKTGVFEIKEAIDSFCSRGE